MEGIGILQIIMPNQDQKARAKPPDGGFGWILVFASSLGHATLIGFEKTKTLYFQQLLSRYGQSTTATAWCISLGDALRFLFSKKANTI